MHKQNRNQKSQANRVHGSTARQIDVVFALERPDAKEVYLCGDFNQWSPMTLRMLQWNADGHWEKRVTLPPGRYEYKFIVDGEWVHDAKARENAPNVHGSLNSVVKVPR
jgi:1,4-alpha-glucan branching enzyme